MPTPAGEIDPSRLQRHLRALSVVRNQILNPVTIRTVTRYITKTFQSTGLSVRPEPFYSWLTGWQRQENLVATIDVSTDSETETQPGRIIIGAHYDTVPFSPGADDNASGVSVLLEVVRVCAEVKRSFKHPVDFIAFGMEEEGLIGSNRHASRLQRAGTRLAAMISLECVGYTDDRPGTQVVPPGLPIQIPDRGTFLGIIGNSPAQPLVDLMQQSAQSHAQGLEVIGLVVEDNGHQFPATRLSDHAPFWDRGFPAMMLTDTAFLRNPNYHQPTDTTDTLDMTFMTRVAQTVLAFILRLGT